LPLATWFRAILEILGDPSVTSSRLQAKLGLARAATVRDMREKILAAMELPDADRLLAGLHHVFARPAVLPEPGVSNRPVLQNGRVTNNPSAFGT
jgi:hypothetical protein